MPSPFPGMDPYLEDEKLWPVFQRHLVTCLNQNLLPGLVDRYRARIVQRHYSTEQPLFTSVVREDHHEDFVEIRQRSNGRLVTLLEIVSLANKTTVVGRQAYLEKRREGRSAGASIVEIDLVLQGQPMLDYSREGLPDWDYAVTVTRSSQPDRSEVYTSVLEKRLPRFKLPLAGDDRDIMVELQTAFSRAFDQGGFLSQVDYEKDPATALTAEKRNWLANHLKQQKLR